MQELDPMSIRDMSKLKSTNEADELIRKMNGGNNDQEIKNDYQALKEVEDLKKLVEKQSYLLHAMWIMLKEKGFTNEDFDKALTESVLLGKRTDYKNTTTCPNCGKGLQSMENKPFTSKCYYCGLEVLDNPYKKYDGIDPYQNAYATGTEEQRGEYVSDAEAEEQEFKEAQDVISKSFEPYDVSKDLNFEDET